jgi:mono/diheme cytochrome c family protein
LYVKNCMIWLIAAVFVGPLAALADEPVDYAREIKPILKARCFKCHGAAEQESDLRLDTAAKAIEGGISGPAIVAKDSRASLLVQAIEGDSDDVSAMPPEEAGPRLTDAQIDLIRRWIDQGAPHPLDEKATDAIARDHSHWAFQPLARPDLPTTITQGETHNAIDRFILARLQAAGLEPSPAANRHTLIRRLCLDLLGLPPTAIAVNEFVDDQRPDAYGRLVERLLASPRYGERWGRHWLDLARYADSDGYTNDVARVIWPYRDWVIDAFNRDLPFDAFTVHQLAGDLLPAATTNQIVATGFHRNTQRNREGGSDAEQYRVESIIDRVSTTGVVFLGLTLGCARCHDHKFDPTSQREFYQLFAFLNNQDEPQLTVPRAGPAHDQLLEIRQRIASQNKQLKERETAIDAGLAVWEAKQTTASSTAVQWRIVSPKSISSSGDSTLQLLPDNSILVGGKIEAPDTYYVSLDHDLPRVSAIRLEVMTHKSLPGGGPGWAGNGNFIIHEIEIASVPDSDAIPALPLDFARAESDHSQPRFPIAHAVDGDKNTGWAINLKPGAAGSIHTNRTAYLVLDEPRTRDDASHIRISLRHYDRKYLVGRFRLSVTDAAPELVTASSLDDLSELLAIPRKKRSKDQQAKVVTGFRQNDSRWASLSQELAQLRAKEKKLAAAATVTTLIMRERSKPRETFVHIRGDFLRPGKQVISDVPDWLHPLPKKEGALNRLDLAHWLTSPANPLTPRVTVNRAWQQLFGRGLVETENDFGLQSTPPSHPQLLDWLAVEFVESGWQVKQLHRLIVSSATYRQSSHVRADLVEQDPGNRLLARQNRLRLEAEAIRDSALAAAGILSTAMKGPSVFPPQPDGVMKMTRNPNRKWVVSTGENRYRRGLYTYFWRSTPHPFLKLFNAPESNTTCTRRDRSNTPLQALTLLNDESFYEAAQAFAVRILRETDSADPGKRIAFAFITGLGRSPTTAEAAAMRELLSDELAEPDLGAQLQRFGPAMSLPAGVDTRQLAAWTSVARVLLNTDEFITRE